jgi:hypothetical protein
MHRIVLVLPQPEGPSSTRDSPSAMSRLQPVDDGGVTVIEAQVVDGHPHRRPLFINSINIES